MTTKQKAPEDEGPPIYLLGRNYLSESFADSPTLKPSIMFPGMQSVQMDTADKFSNRVGRNE